MPNDAKLGFVVGVGLVIAVAVVFFRRDMPAAADPAAHSVQPEPAAQDARRTPATPSAVRSRPVDAQTGVRTGHEPAPGEGRCHTVREGDTLFSLAQHYYGDRDKYDLIYRSNRSQLGDTDFLRPGTVLVIPDLPERP
jgi:nucleoid-associated protein YgaU